MGKAGLLYGVKNAGDTKFVGNVSNEVVMDLDFANTFELALNEDGKQYAMVNGNARAVDFAGEVVGTLKIGLDVINNDIQQFMLGCKALSGLKQILKIQDFTLTVDNETVTTALEAKSLLEVSVLRKDNTKKRRLINATLDTDGKVICSGGKAGDKVRVYYFNEKDVRGFKFNTNDGFTEDYRVYADVIGKTWAGGEKLPFQYQLYKVSPQRSITFGFDGANVAKFELNFDVLANEDGDMFTTLEVEGEEDTMEDLAKVPTLLLAVGENDASKCTLGFSKPENATEIKVQYKKGSGSWTNVAEDGGIGISIPAPLTADDEQVVISNIEKPGTYKFRLVVDGAYSAESNDVVFTA